jgi:hypothetical protein
LSLQSVHAGVEGAVVSMEASHDLLSPIADRWTLPKFGTPMAAEDGTDARTDGKKSTPSRKVTSRPARQLRTWPWTPNATFYPENPQRFPDKDYL